MFLPYLIVEQPAIEATPPTFVTLHKSDAEVNNPMEHLTYSHLTFGELLIDMSNLNDHYLAPVLEKFLNRDLEMVKHGRCIVACPRIFTFD